MTAPRVSIITPVYNHALFLRETASAVLGQAFRAIEWILIDDGSTDGSVELAEKIAAENPGVPIRHAVQEHAGAAAARNLGFVFSGGEFILPLDGDDALAPDAVEKLVRALDAKPEFSFAYSDIVMFGDVTGIARSRPWNVDEIKQYNFVPVAALVRRSSFEAVGGYRAEEGMLADWGLWLSMAAHGFAGIYVPGPLFRYRRHPAQWSESGQQDRDRLKELLRRNRPALFGEVMT